MGRSSALGIIATSAWLASGGKYKSVRPGITIARAVHFNFAFYSQPPDLGSRLDEMFSGRGIGIMYGSARTLIYSALILSN